ncbi:MAG: GHKL domain-containing protein [Gloeobacteraceae cyanobacterium ES-bin-316]|nr:GHKL domain-containing protein [Ferruginibacter sp.]
MEALNLDVDKEDTKRRIEELISVNKELVEIRNQQKFTATGRIARMIAHEVRNPLTNINLAVEQLRAEFPPEANSRFLFDMIERNSKRINQIISELLDSTKFSQLHFSTNSLKEILEESMQDSEISTLLKHVQIIKNYAADAETICVDREKLKIAFLHIIKNALQAMEGSEHPRLTIETSKLAGKLIIVISDTGCGMDVEAQSKVFEPYYTTKAGSHGLGLTTTQNIILNHEGNINLTSEAGKGTSFKIRIGQGGVN